MEGRRLRADGTATGSSPCGVEFYKGGGLAALLFEAGCTFRDNVAGELRELK